MKEKEKSKKKHFLFDCLNRRNDSLFSPLRGCAMLIGRFSN